MHGAGARSSAGKNFAALGKEASELSSVLIIYTVMGSLRAECANFFALAIPTAAARGLGVP